MQLYPYVYINADGTARELHATERAWLETEYALGDGAAPRVKDSYDDLNGWGEIKGYLQRADLPAGMAVGDAPAEDPIKPMSRADTIAWLRGKGVEVTENDDGSLTVHGLPDKVRR
jgi:hypothetical protein